jgi:gluconokinase
MVVVLMGASGSGKSTVGRALAERLHWQFLDADDLHSPANIAKMSQGIGLDDLDRREWLARLNDSMRNAAAQGAGLVVACSALRERYRTRLARGVPEIRWVFLRADPELLRRRLAERQGHFAGPALLDTQLATLEPPLDAVSVDAAAPVPAIVDKICEALQR